MRVGDIYPTIQEPLGIVETIYLDGKYIIVLLNNSHGCPGRVLIWRSDSGDKNLVSTGGLYLKNAFAYDTYIAHIVNLQASTHPMTMQAFAEQVIPSHEQWLSEQIEMALQEALG